MLRGSDVLGSVGVARAIPGPFRDREIALLQAFADQAVIAIENMRLFKELEARNRDLTEALDRQTATAEILRVISQSQTEVQPVFDTIVDNAIRLFRAWAVAAMRSDGQLLHLIAVRGGTPGTRGLSATTVALADSGAAPRLTLRGPPGPHPHSGRGIGSHLGPGDTRSGTYPRVAIGSRRSHAA
jgi:hypothetical protein